MVYDWFSWLFQGYYKTLDDRVAQQGKRDHKSPPFSSKGGMAVIFRHMPNYLLPLASPSALYKFSPQRNAILRGNTMSAEHA
jgi:hypothetical protein